jgi:hypothetical protein
MERRSTSRLEWLVALGLLAMPVAQADEDGQEAFHDVGAVLGWRLAPEILEERCRTIDPAGAGVRKKALQAWLAKNDALIHQVDSRVAEVVPLLLQSAGANAVRDVREQVRKMLVESITPEACQAERDPHSSTWTSNGMPHVAESLAALYDWKVSHSPR